MTSEEKASAQYRFSGFQLFKLQLDETGPAYVEATPHPYYYNQPEYWSKPFFQGGAGPTAVEHAASKTTQNQLYQMIIAFS